MNFKEEMSKLPEPFTDKKPPFWEYWRWQLWRLAQQDDPVNFMSWPCVYHCMLVNHWDMITEFHYIYPDKKDRYIPAVIPHIGNPPDYFRGRKDLSSNMINQAYHVALWENATGKRINELDTIVEFGGGYGAMALLCWRLGFRGKYIIYDLPEFALLQQWFLEQEWVNNVQWPKKWGRRNADLLIALYSLSEMPVADRDRFLGLVRAESYLFLYSPTWETYNNLTYFSQFADSKGMKWRSQPTPREIDSYLMGWKYANR